MSNTYNVAVLITCHNRKEKTVKCLKALFEAKLTNEVKKIDVYLVDDSSTDNTSELVKDKFPQVNIIQGNGNLFWNRGMNLAWQTAVNEDNYDYYLWLNDDTLLFKNALVQLLNRAEVTGNKRIVVGATCSEVNNLVTYSGYNFPKIKLVPNGTWQDCDYFNGNIVLIPVYVNKRVRGLDKRFRHALGDFDYGMRAHQLGFIHTLSPIALGTCEEHETDPTWRNKKVPFYKRLRHLYSPLGNHPIEFFVFDRRHYGLFNALFHFFTIHLRCLFPGIWRSTLIEKP